MKIAVYGTGNDAEFIVKILKLNKEWDDVVCFIETLPPPRSLSEKYGKKIYSINEINFSDYDKIIISSRKYESEIRQELSKKEHYEKSFILNYEDFLKEQMSADSEMKKVLDIFFSRPRYFSQLMESHWYEEQVPPGHYYSVLPNSDDVDRHLRNDFLDLSSIDLNEDKQTEVLTKMLPLYGNIDFVKNKIELSGGKRFYSLNGSYEIGDGSFLNMFLRLTQPGKIIEIGSGFSSAVMLDTYEFYLKKQINLTCIEPYPERLQKLLKNDNEVTLLQKPLQSIPFNEITDNLDSGDLLFIDSTHVIKYGSDVMYIFNKIFPNLKSGVYIHFHDIFYPFDNPREWIEDGRCWNEVYFLKQFLAYNNAFEIVLWPSMFHNTKREYMQQYFSDTCLNPGASIYLRKK